MKRKNYSSPEIEEIGLDDDVLEYVTGGDGSEINITWRGRGGGDSCDGEHYPVRNFSAGKNSNCY